MLYRPFLREAWRRTWERKSLWIFGIFAALISTGGVMDTALRAIENVTHTASLLVNLADASFIGYDTASRYISQLALLGSQRVSLLLTIATLVGILLIVIATLSQGVLILGAGKTSPKGFTLLWREALPHFWSLFLIGLLNKLLMVILVGLMTLPLLLVSLSTTLGNGILFVALMLLFVPASIIVNVIYMFALIDVVETGAHPLSAIHTGLKLFGKQWLATFEYGLILFFTVLGAGLILLIAMTLLFIPFSILYATFLLSGSFSWFLITSTVSALLLVALILLFSGACVTFQYSAWYYFYKHGLHKTHGKKVFSKILRLAYPSMILLWRK